jgi:hypothetical protein
MLNGGVQTAHGLAGLIGLAVLLILLFHFMGFRTVFTVGRAVA